MQLHSPPLSSPGQTASFLLSENFYPWCLERRMSLIGNPILDSCLSFSSWCFNLKSKHLSSNNDKKYIRTILYAHKLKEKYKISRKWFSIIIEIKQVGGKNKSSRCSYNNVKGEWKSVFYITNLICIQDLEFTDEYFCHIIHHSLPLERRKIEKLKTCSLL